MTESARLDAQKLLRWRLEWADDEFEWRDRQDGWSDQRREEREQRKRERRARDRRYFGLAGWGISKRHRTAEVRVAHLQKHALPVFRSEAELAEWLGISLSRLRWFTYHRTANTAYHYIRYSIPKRRGGTRVILAPKTELKAFQRKVLREMLDRVKTRPAAHGFIRGRSILTNAQPHVGRKFVLNLDLKDFFPSITFPRVRGLFIALGYAFPVASALALLCTECDREKVERSDKTFYVALGPRHLVQGAPTSPAIANLMARRLDQRLTGLAVRHQVTYTRYADDLTFSGNDKDVLMRVLASAKRIITAEGYTPHPDKTRLYRQSGRQMVTGLVVNSAPHVPRDVRRTVRAILHNAAKTGLAAQNRDSRPDFRAYLHGLIGHVALTHPELAVKFREQLRALGD